MERERELGGDGQFGESSDVIKKCRGRKRLGEVLLSPCWGLKVLQQQFYITKNS